MYKYLSLNKEGFSKNAGFLGLGDTARESSKYVKKDDKKGTPRAHQSVLSYDAPEQKATTAKNMGVGPAKGHRSTLSYEKAEQNAKSTDTTKGPAKGHRSVLSYEKAEQNKSTDTTKGPAKGHRSTLSYEKAEPNTRKFNAPANGTPAPTTIVRPLPKVEKPTKPANIEHNPDAVNGINIPEVGKDPNATLPGPDTTPPAPLSAEAFPLGEIQVDKPQGADTSLPADKVKEPAPLDPDPEAKPKPESKPVDEVKEPAPLNPDPLNPETKPEGKPEAKPEGKPLSRLEVKDTETQPVSIMDEIFSSHNIRNNVLPGAGIAAGIGGLAGALMEDSNPIATALGTGAGAGAGTLLWDYLSRNEDTQKYIKDFQEWAGKNLWEGADGHVKYLAPALGGLAGLLITK